MPREMRGVSNFVEQAPALSGHWGLPDLKLSRQSRMIWE